MDQFRRRIWQMNCTCIHHCRLVTWICLIIGGLTVYRTLQLRRNFTTQHIKRLVLLNQVSSLESEYEMRLERIQNVCRKYNLDQNAFQQKMKQTNKDGSTTQKYCSTENCTVVVDLRTRILACLVPKVGCTTIKRYFMRLLGLNESKLLSKQERQNLHKFHVFADQVLYRVTPNYYEQEELDRFFKFVFVRHPFERLVSAFVDKTNSANHIFYKTYWIPIMKKSGRKDITNSSKPTFREFVHYLLSLPVEAYTEHWAPYWRRCEPCKIKYDFVGKLENGDVDVPYALDQHPVANLTLKWNSGLNTTAKTKEFFAKLNASEIMALYTRYYLDFELFGYDIDEYLEGKDVRKMDILKINGKKS